MKYLAMMAITLLVAFIIFILVEVCKELKPYIKCSGYIAMVFLLMPFSSNKKIAIKILTRLINSLDILIDTKSGVDDKYINARTKAEMLRHELEGGNIDEI